MLKLNNTVRHTIATWLPVTLSCGHTQQINFTVSEGSVLGCTDCAKAPALDWFNQSYDYSSNGHTHG